jgi:hypothetical protein
LHDTFGTNEDQSLKCNFQRWFSKHDKVLQQKAASDYFLTLKS